MVSITKHKLLQDHKPCRQDRSACYVLLIVVQFHVGYNQIVVQIDGFQRNGSGWVVDHILILDLQSFAKYLRLTPACEIVK